MVRTLAEPQEPTESEEIVEEVPDDVLLGLWPGNWNGNSYVNLYFLGDPAAWLEESLGEPAVDGVQQRFLHFRAIRISPRGHYKFGVLPLVTVFRRPAETSIRRTEERPIWS